MIDKIMIAIMAMIKMLKLWGGLLLIVVPTLLLIQLISYQLFNFNIYKKLKYILIDRELNK